MAIEFDVRGRDIPGHSFVGVNPSSHRSGGVGYFVHGTSVGDFRNRVIRPPG